MKKITSFLLLVAVFAMAFSLTAFAADTNVFTITADKTSASAGDTVVVTVELTGDLMNVAMVQLPVAYDTTKFSVNVGTDRNSGYKCFDADWYKAMKNDYAGLGAINAPNCGETPAGQVNLLYVSSDGYYIDSSSDLNSENATTTAALLKFTALVDVTTIDSSCFSIVEDPTQLLVDEVDKSHHTVSAVQIKAAEPVIEYKEVVNAVDADVTTLSDGTYTWENIAIYKATFDLDNIVAEKGYGIKAGDYSYGAAVKGIGTVDYVLAFYGIADTDDLAVSEYYTVVKK